MIKIANNTLGDTIQKQIDYTLQTIPKPLQCTITKIYNDNRVDATTETGLIKYAQTIGKPRLNDEALVVFTTDQTPIIITQQNWLLQKLGLNQSSANKFNFAVIKKTEATITYEEFWILSNAYYNYDAQRFVKIDTTHASFGIQIQANGSYPGEAELGYNDNVGINIWRNPKATDVYKDTTTYDYSDFENKNYIGAKVKSTGKWKEFAISSGWSNTFMLDSYGGMTIGGAGFEVDGNGIFPFTRLTSSQYTDSSNNTYALLGLLDNAYHPTLWGWECDSNSTYSWFVGLRTPVTNNVKDNTNTEFVIMYNNTSSDTSHPHTMSASNWNIVFRVGVNGVVTE